MIFLTVILITLGIIWVLGIGFLFFVSMLEGGQETAAREILFWPYYVLRGK